MPDSWDYEADIVIVGGGGSGCMAACAAHEEGSSSLIIEKADYLGGDTALCACICVGPWPDRTKQDSGMDDTIELYLEDQKNSNPWSHRGLRGEGLSDDYSFFERQAELMPETFAWMQDVAGIEWDARYYSNSTAVPQPGWDTVYPRDWTAANKIIPQLESLVRSYDDVEVVMGTEVCELVVDDSGRIVGACGIDEKGATMFAKARKAVIVATGTFNGNRGMVDKHLGPAVSKLTPGGCATVTGDGHRMVQRIGGTLRDMTLGTHWLPHTLGAETRTLTGTLFAHGPIYDNYPPGILVNFDGRRYCNENDGYSLVGQSTAEQKWREGFYVVDAQGAKGTVPEDQTSEIVITAGTLEELGGKMVVNTEAFLEEVARYNGFVDAGKDDDFGKELESCPRIEQPPFYAFPIRPVPYTTYGGVVVDVDGHVLDARGDAIPGLYAAGLCCGSFAEQAGVFYTGGVSQAMAFGRQAGKNASQEEVQG